MAVSSEADLTVSSAPDLAISSGAATSALTPAQQNWIIQLWQLNPRHHQETLVLSHHPHQRLMEV